MCVRFGKMSWPFSREEPVRWLEWAWPGGGSRASPMAGTASQDKDTDKRATVWTELGDMFTFGGGKN